MIWCDVIFVQPPPRKIPRTIENTREFDETVCKPDDEVLPHSYCSANFQFIVICSGEYLGRFVLLFLLMAKIANACRSLCANSVGL